MFGECERMRLKKGQSYLEVIAGPMFSGKTREMHRQYEVFKICNMKVQVFRRDIDTRYGLEGIRTHDGIQFKTEDVFYAKNSDDIAKQLKEDNDVIMIDEAMFYDKTLVEKIDEWINSGKVVIVNMLNTDFAGNVFGIAGDLMAKADFITSLTARCTYQENGIFCHEPATRSLRKVPIKSQIVIGGIETYEARCRKHHFVLDEDRMISSFVKKQSKLPGKNAATKTIIFDLDGVLLDSREANFRAFRVVHDALSSKTDFTMDKFLEWYTPNYFELFGKMEIPESEWMRAGQIWRQHYISNESPELFAHTQEILSYLKSKGFKLALVTNGSENRVNLDLERRKIKQFFDVVVNGEGLKLEEIKPAPTQLFMALEKLGENAKSAVYIGDTAIDVLAGKNAGMKTIAITAGFGLLEKLKESNPDHIIDDLKELETIF
jgi:thymidine kinase